MIPDYLFGGFISTNKVMEFIKDLRVCDMDAMQPEDLITHESLVQEATHEYRDLVDSKRW